MAKCTKYKTQMVLLGFLLNQNLKFWTQYKVDNIKLGTIWESRQIPGREVQIVEVATKHVFYENLSDRACFSQKKILFSTHYEYLREKK